MSWGDDVRCLYCDCRLPLYRKLTDGQFCSAAHRKAYWVEQQRLGVERLHQFQTGSFAIPSQTGSLPVPLQTAIPEPAPPGDELQPAEIAALLAAEEAETIAQSPDVVVSPVEPAVAVHTEVEPEIVAESVPDIESDPIPVLVTHSAAKAAALFVRSSDNGMPAAGLLAMPLRATPERASAMLAADPIEYEISARPVTPTIGSSGKNGKRELPQAGPVPIPKSAMADRVVYPDAAPEDPNWTSLVACSPTTLGDSLTGNQLHAAMGPAATGLASLPWHPIEYRLDATKRAEPARFPAASAALPLSIVAPADEMLDAIGALIPAFVRPLRSLAVSARDERFRPALVESFTSETDFVIGSAFPERGQTVLHTGVLQPLQPLPLSAIGMAIALRESEVAAMWTQAELPFATPRTPVELLTASVGWGQLASLPWDAASGGRAEWHPVLLDRVIPEAFLGTIHGPEFVVHREIASFKGSAQQRKIEGPKIRDVAASRAAQVPRVYFAPQPASSTPLFPVAHLEPVDAAPSQTPAMEFVFAPQRPGAAPAPIPRHKTLHHQGDADEPRQSLLELVRLAPVAAWKNAPRDLKLLAMALPLLIGLAIQPSLPKVRVTASVPNPEISRVVETQWNGLRRNILDRAGVELSDDFRSGLEAWQSKSDLASTWSYDGAGFVKPGPLALYEPSLKLTDYQVQFLGQISKKALGFVYRATDLDNYYVAKMVILKPGPLPTIGLQRYAVVNGQAGPMVEKILPITARNGQFYRVRLDVEGEYFALSVQGHLVDFWSDSRWKSGGVGFFNAPGEESRVRWVQVSHQYDALGRLCAYLAPYSVPGAAGGLKE